MNIGFFGINTGVFSTREAVTRVAQTAEQAGYESIWTGEHLVLVDPQVAPSPVPPQTRMVDTIATLAFAAAVTERVKRGSGINLLAQRNRPYEAQIDFQILHEFMFFPAFRNKPRTQIDTPG